MPSGYATGFRLAAVWKDRIFLYQAWRNPRARTGRDLFDIGGKVRAIDVQRGEAAASEVGIRAIIAEAADVEALVNLIMRATVRRPSPHGAGELRYWLPLLLIEAPPWAGPFPSRASCWRQWTAAEFRALASANPMTHALALTSAAAA